MVPTLSITPHAQGSSQVRDLLADPIFEQACALGLARLIPYTSERLLAAGEYLYRAGQSAQEFFYLLDGQVRLVTQKQQEIICDNRRLGEEAATDFDTYLADAVAQTPLRVLVLSRKSLSILFESKPALKAEFYFSLMQTFAGDHLHQTSRISASRAAIRRAAQSRKLDQPSRLAVGAYCARPGVAVWPRLGLGEKRGVFPGDFFLDHCDVGLQPGG